MFLSTSALMLSVGLHAITSAALPTANRGPLLTARDDDQCAPNTNFYVCSINGFRGCCSVDPCAMEEGCPVDQSPPAPEQPICVDGKARIYNPAMSDVDPKTGNSIPTTNVFHVLKTPDETTMQTMTFDLPSEAVGKLCDVQYSVPAEREFTVSKSGLVNVRQVAPQQHDKIAQIDFTQWGVTEGPHDHHGTNAKCEEHMGFDLWLHNEGEVTLVQNEETGWYVQYDC